MVRLVGPLQHDVTMTGSVAGRYRDDRLAVALVVLAWSTIVVPRLVQSFTAPKYRTTVGTPVPLSSPATYFDGGLVAILGAFFLAVLVVHLRDLPVTRRRELAVLLAPWLYLLARDIYVDHRPDRGALLYPMVVIALWILRPRMERLAVLGYLVGFTALVSLFLGAFIPAKGIYTSVTGELIQPDKQILPGGLLIGTFTDSNNLGQFLVLGLPVIGLIPRRWVRIILMAATVYAIVWSSSRSSIGAALAGLVAVLAMTAVPANGRRALSLLAVGTAAVVLIALPLLTMSDTAFTNRGAIWRAGIRAWSASPVDGWGSQYYSELAKYANGLGGLAFHGHNQLVQTLVVGGLINVALLVLVGITAMISAARWAGTGRMFPTVYLTVFLVSCMFEVSFGLVDREFLVPVAILPVAYFLLADPDARSHDRTPAGSPARQDVRS
jgi:O-antigen ligase